jgi:hypothetical protein
MVRTQMLHARLNLPSPIRSATVGWAIAVATLLVSCASSSKPEGYSQEQYTKVDDPKALDLDFQATVSFHVENGSPNNIKVHIERFSVAGKDVELLSRDLVNEGENWWVLTKAYGRMKVTLNNNESQSGCDLWVTPSQKSALKALHSSQ